MVVLDTCALIEACEKKPSFSAKTFKQIEKGSYILSVAFAEIACKVKLGKLEMGVSPKVLYEAYIQIKEVEIVDISVDEWLESIELDWDNRDPADRLLAAFAIKRDLPIVSTDKKLAKFYKKVIW